MHGRTRLLAWMRRAGLNQRQTAQEIGMHFTHLNKILTGYQNPGLKNALLIESATGIPVESWMPTPESEADRRRKPNAKHAPVA